LPFDNWIVEHSDENNNKKVGLAHASRNSAAVSIDKKEVKKLKTVWICLYM